VAGPIVVFSRRDSEGAGQVAGALAARDIDARSCTYGRWARSAGRLTDTVEHVRAEVKLAAAVVLWAIPTGRMGATLPFDELPSALDWSASDLFAAGRVLYEVYAGRAGAVVVVTSADAWGTNPPLGGAIESHAAVAFTRVLASALGPLSRCNALCVRGSALDLADDIAANIAFLAGPDAAHITGQSILLSRDLVLR
jgi:hypothetical protein